MRRTFKKTFIVQLGATAVIILILVVVQVVVGFDTSRRIDQIQASERAFSRARQASESFLVLTEEAKKAAGQVDRLRRLLPSIDSLIQFPKDLRALAVSHNIALGFTFSGQAPSTAIEPGSISFQITADGDRVAFLDFLDAIAASPYFVSFDTIKYVKHVRDDSVEVTMSGRVFGR
jgi:hypothetical protein